MNPSHSLLRRVRARRLQLESLERRQMLAASTLQIFAAGETGEEQIELQIAGATVASFSSLGGDYFSGAFQTFQYTHPTEVSADQVRVAFVNDGPATGGGDRNVRIDAIAIDGVRYETEADGVISTGSWVAGVGCAPGVWQSEFLQCGGYFQYAAPSDGQITLWAAGETGEETIELQIDGATVATYANVGGDYFGGSYQTFTYRHAETVTPDRIRVAFVNDGPAIGGGDRNVRIDAIAIDGARYESEAQNVLSTGTWIEGVGCEPGFWQSEFLQCGGALQFGVGGASVEVFAAGETGEEQIELRVDGAAVATFNNVGGDYLGGSFVTLAYVHPTTLAASQIEVAYINDGLTAGGADRNLRVDAIAINAVRYEAEAAEVYSTGTWISGIGCEPGLWRSEFLPCGGSLQFGSTAQPGTLALGATLASADENAGTISIPVVRTGGSDGTVGLEYTTVDASATAGIDYIAQTGILLFGPGETTKNLVLSILDDGVDEGNETFNVAGDFVLGGAALGLPRTATVTIVDDDGAPQPGTGNGLLGEYYDDAALTSFALSRTDATVDFNWGSGSPDPAIGIDTFSVRWSGQIEPLYTETYAFHVTTDDGTRLWVDDQLVIDSWVDQSPNTKTGQIALQGGGRTSIRLEYYENGGGAVQTLEWSSPRQVREVVPETQLYSDPADPIDGSFAGQAVVSGLNRPLALDFDPSGRMFIAEQRGVVRIYANGALLPTPFIDIQTQVNNVQDRGLLGVAVHPQFPAVPYVYLSYVYDPPETIGRTGLAGPDGTGNRVARLTRVTANPATNYSTALPGSETVLLGTNSVWANISSPNLDSTNDMTIAPSCSPDGTMQDCLPADSRSHTIGNVAFGDDGSLYVSNGDGTSFGRVDPRTTRVQDIDSLSGKLLRIDPLTGEGLADNPFYNGDPNANRSKVVSYGLRNPFRFALHPDTQEPYIGDVGWNTFEEINRGAGQNFGWPFYEGDIGVNRPTGGYNTLPEAAAFYADNNATPPLFGRFHADGGVASVAGDFYTGDVYPGAVQGGLFFTDFGDGIIRVLRLNPDGSVKDVVPLNTTVGSVVEMTMGSDGFLYYADLDGSVGRITYSPNAAVQNAASNIASESGSGPAANGDFNGDSVTDGSDWLAWQRGFGLSGDADAVDGDADANRRVNAVDLAIWESFAGVAVPATTTAAATSDDSWVEEPQTRSRGRVARRVDWDQALLESLNL